MNEWQTWEQASIGLRHYRMRKLLGSNKPLKCPCCGMIKKIELSNKSHNYLEDPSDWQYLCHQCHSDYDMKNNSKSTFYEKFNNLFKRKEWRMSENEN